MSERTTGIILRTRPLTETSLIVEWLTQDFGRLSTVAKGARRPKSPFRGKLDLFYLAEFSFLRSRRSELHVLCEVGLFTTNASLRQELAYLQQASYCAALVQQTTETGTPIPVVFNLFKGMLERLPTTPPQPRTIFAFELKLLHELGLGPDLRTTNLSPVAKQLLQDLLHSDWREISRLKPDQVQVVEARQFLHGFLIYHLGKLPHGRSVAIKTT